MVRVFFYLNIKYGFNKNLKKDTMYDLFKERNNHKQRYQSIYFDKRNTRKI